MTAADGGASATDAGWRRIAFALFGVAFGTNVSTPLLLIYRDRLDLSATALTGIFGVYAAGLLPALLLAGPISDRIGRRPLALPFVALAAIASALFIPAASSVPLLFVCRFLQGIVSGAVFVVASAWLQDLSAHRPTRAPGQASIAMNAGFSLGPLTSGLLGQYAPAPTALPFAVHIGLVLLGFAVVSRVHEPARGGPVARLARPRLPPGVRSEFWSVLVPTAICVFAFPSVTVTVLPLLLPAGSPGVAVTGVVAGVTLGAAAVITPAARLLGARAGPVAAALGAAGFGLAAVEGEGLAAVALIVAAVLLGCGSGLALTAGLALVQRMSTPTSRGAVNAAFYAWAYVGFALPLLVAATAAGGSPAGPLAIVAVVVAGLAGWLALMGRILGLRRRRADAVEQPGNEVPLAERPWRRP